MNFINTLHSLPNSCVFAIINPVSSKCYVGYANNLKSRIGQILDDFPELVGDRSYIKILLKTEELLYKQIYSQYYVEKYVTAGFDVVKAKISYSKYKPKILVNCSIPAVFVVIENIRKDKTVVGVFENMDEAKGFVAQYYVGVDLVQPVYALNDRTMEWVKKRK
jgi:hypothetical protein